MSSGLTFVQLTLAWADTATSGSLLTLKHDIHGPARGEPIRSVLSGPLSASLETFINSRDYTIEEYYNNKYNNHYYVVLPGPTQPFSPAGYEVLSGSQATGSALDRIVIVSGSNQG
jgi:hypothetical protein